MEGRGISKKKENKNIFRIIINALCAVCLFFKKAAQNSIFAHILTKAGDANAASAPSISSLSSSSSSSSSSSDAPASFIARLISRIGIENRIIKPVRKAVSKEIENSAVIAHVSSFISLLLDCRIRVFGSFLFSFGFFSVLVRFIKNIIASGSFLSFDGMIFGISVVFSSIPLLFLGNISLSEGICRSRLFSLLLFDVLGLYRENFESRSEVRSENSLIAFLIGAAFGCATAVVDAKYIAAAIVAVVIGLIVLIMPESGIVLTLLILPFVRTTYLIVMIIVCMFSFFIKLLRGQRSLRFDMTDGAIVLFAILLLFGGLFSASKTGSMKSALVYAAFIGGYFLAANLLRTRAWLIRAVGAIIFGLFAESCIGIVEYLLGYAKLNWFDTSLFSGISGRAVATFENPNVLGEFIVLSIPFAIALAARKGKGKRRVACAFVCVAAIVCAVFTWSRGAWLALAVCCGAMLLMVSEKFLLAFFAIAAAMPFARFWMPQNVYARLTSIGSLADSSSVYRLSVWKSSFSLAFDHLLTGIGIGSAAFGAVYPSYAYSGCESALHSHNLFLQIVVEIGLPGLLVFLFIIFMSFARSAKSLKESHRKSPLLRLISYASISGVLGLLVQGLTDHVFYNYRIYLLFFIILGILCATNRFMTAEEKVYFGNTDPGDGTAYETDLIYETVSARAMKKQKQKQKQIKQNEKPKKKNVRVYEIKSASDILREEEEEALGRKNAEKQSPHVIRKENNIEGGKINAATTDSDDHDEARQ